jgi:hypothetical protein
VLLRRLFAYVASATETSASKPTMAAFSAGVAYKMLSSNWARFFAPICRGKGFSFEEVKSG